ncbi:hypothetical protein CN359_30495 [Bacillus thuringiensis]|nr:hypothetical protein CN359_30495 [Bacillus thuringiensis]
MRVIRRGVRRRQGAGRVTGGGLRGNGRAAETLVDLIHGGVEVTQHTEVIGRHVERQVEVLCLVRCGHIEPASLSGDHHALEVRNVQVIDVVQILGGDPVTTIELSLIDVMDNIDDALVLPRHRGEPVVRGQAGKHELADRLQFGDRQRHVIQLPGRESHPAEVLSQEPADRVPVVHVIDELLEGGALAFEPVEDVYNVRLEVLLDECLQVILERVELVIVLGDGVRQHLTDLGGEGVVPLHLLAHVHQEPGDGRVVVGRQSLHLRRELVDKPLTHPRPHLLHELEVGVPVAVGERCDVRDPVVTGGQLILVINIVHSPIRSRTRLLKIGSA